MDLQFSARVSGTTDALVLDGLRGTVGETDFSGRVQLDLKGKPNVDIQLQSESLNLAAFSATPPPGPAPKPVATGPFIPDVALPLDLLTQFNGRISVQAGKLQVAGSDYSALRVEATIRNGQLIADPFQIASANGAVAGRFEVQQGGGGLPLLKAAGKFSDLVLGFDGGGKNPEQQLKYDGKFDLSGRGRTLRELAGSLLGRIRLISGPGRLPNSRLTSVYSSFLGELWTSLNPLVKRQPYTDVVCAAYLLRADNGVLQTDPALVLRTKEIDVISHGSINLRSEAIDFNFKTVARGGFGISLGQLINPYIKVTGTLAKPRLTLDPTGSLVTGGAAVATGGLSILATTLWDRLFRQQDPCATAIAEADKRAAAAPALRRSSLPVCRRCGSGRAAQHLDRCRNLAAQGIDRCRLGCHQGVIAGSADGFLEHRVADLGFLARSGLDGPQRLDGHVAARRGIEALDLGGDPPQRPARGRLRLHRDGGVGQQLVEVRGEDAGDLGLQRGGPALHLEHVDAVVGRPRDELRADRASRAGSPARQGFHRSWSC